MNLDPFLDDLSRRIDTDEEQRLQSAWRTFLDGKAADDEVFVPPSRSPKPAKVTWPDVHINDALGDIDLMVLHQLSMVSRELAEGSNTVLNVRTNYGVSIMTSQLGCRVVLMSREQGNLPTTRPLGEDAHAATIGRAKSDDDGASRTAAIRDAIDRGVPDLRSGQGAMVFDCAERFAEIFAGHTEIAQSVILYHPDTQGPIDNAELAWGSDIFVAFYDSPDLVHQFLDLMTDHYIAFLSKWFKLYPPPKYNAHWGNMLLGNVMLRDDSLMNLSPEIYRQFILKREERCLSSLGGGAIHFCGRGSHVIEAMGKIRGLTGINLSQPELNEMETIYHATVDRGINLLGLAPSAARVAIENGRPLRGRVHCKERP